MNCWSCVSGLWVVRSKPIRITRRAIVVLSILQGNRINLLDLSLPPGIGRSRTCRLLCRTMSLYKVLVVVALELNQLIREVNYVGIPYIVVRVSESRNISSTH